MERSFPTAFHHHHVPFQNPRGRTLQKVKVAFQFSNDNATHESKVKMLGKKEIYFPLPGSMLNQTVVISGAASGLGLESAKRLAAAGANVIVTARSTEKVDWAVTTVNKYLQRHNYCNVSGNVIGLELDLDDLQSVKSFPNRYEEKIRHHMLLGVPLRKPIDVLMNNAGCGAIPNREFTKDGFERIFQSNHLGHFALTALLFPYFNRDGCRVINVSSQAHSAARLANTGTKGIDIDNIVMSNLQYCRSGPYQQSKLANVLFTQELQRRANQVRINNWFHTVSMEPGIISTAIWRYICGEDPRSSKKDDGWQTVERLNHIVPGGNFLQWLASSIFYRILTPTNLGANCQIWLASTPIKNVKGGMHYGSDMQIINLEDFAKDRKKALELWEVSEKCSGIDFTIQKETIASN